MTHTYSPQQQKAFTGRLMRWRETFPPREMPWRGERDPYRIWLSEVILQQTRVEQGRGYYERFCSRFPTVKALAKATEAEVFKLWEGLGYYARARNLHATAQYIHNEKKGQFPNGYDDLLRLKGIGPYTAAAIASFAYREPRAVVDGNVIRVLARVFGIAEAPVRAAAKKTFQAIADACLDIQRPDEYNQAIMDFGAQICTPHSPLCAECPMQSICFAHNKELVHELPVKVHKKGLRNRYFHYFVIHNRQQVLLQQRSGKDIWRGLWEFPLWEAPDEKNRKVPAPFSDLVARHKAPEWESVQLLSHQRIHTAFYIREVKSLSPYLCTDRIALTFAEAEKKSFPLSVRNLLKSELWPG
jgi:A/G-specific adenine glycosylase